MAENGIREARFSVRLPYRTPDHLQDALRIPLAEQGFTMDRWSWKYELTSRFQWNFPVSYFSSICQTVYIINWKASL
jgi:hypothetical protein